MWCWRFWAQLSFLDADEGNISYATDSRLLVAHQMLAANSRAFHFCGPVMGNQQMLQDSVLCLLRKGFKRVSVFLFRVELVWFSDKYIYILYKDEDRYTACTDKSTDCCVFVVDLHK